MSGMCRFIAGVLILAMCLMGCTTTGTTTDGQRTRNEGTAVGAGTGAVLGGLIGALVGGDSKGALIGAAIGAAAGGVAGYSYGDHVASKKAEYAKEEDWLDECIASARKINQETLAYNNEIRNDIAQLDVETRKLKQQYAAKQASKDTLLAEKKNIDETIKLTDEKLARAKFELDSQKQALAQVGQKGSVDQSKALDAEIAKLSTLISELEQYSENLASLSGRMAV
ncbi:Glycine zipper [Desulfocicer vacuolatum DSM 3385]|uniref:Glycine zipper n=1 Tax=Desulfocicer vacuolatum DSM 3385 TaxID=1121400 RepID=A0A1W2DYB4_9BACT|nr:glycine zipper domain-containing protein [Desulfocicer vacuolatum]SMD02307.1 Glycine zipper [Desulfocicer vacuolatum DSM 3385]